MSPEKITQNFEIIDGKLFQNGHEIVPRVGINPIPKEDSVQNVESAPTKKSQKRMRWYKGSFLTDQQETDEQKQIDDHIA
jgi:hypothetical protein